MFMRQPDEMPVFRANLPRTDHVLSHEFDFTCPPASLLPVFHTFMNPGEKIRLGFDFNLRTMPLESAAFGDIDVRTEYFFVPIQLLFQPFDAVYYGVTDNFSSNFAYGNSVNLPIVDIDDIVNGLHSVRSNGIMVRPNSSQAIETIGQSAIRLFDMFGFNPIGIACLDTDGGNFYNPSVFPYQFLAYNCIYEYYYRLDSRQQFDQRLFNMDAFYNFGGSIQTSDLPWYVSMFTLKYRPLDNDYFTDVKVSPIVDVLNLNNKSSLELSNNWLSREKMVNYINTQVPVLSSGGVGSATSDTGSVSPGSLNNPSTTIQKNFGFKTSFVNQFAIGVQLSNGLDINTANIRALFANEKLWSITGRAKKNYDDQTLAHFGFNVPHDVKHQITCFGRDHTKVHIGEVISTASTTQAPLGEIAGKGYGVQQGSQHDFVAPCHGVVMAIFSVTIRHNYEAGVLKANVVTGRNDLYVPEFDHLGMQPLFGYETKFLGGNIVSSTVPSIMGWQYRYEQWKRRYNRTSGAFRYGGSLKSWVPTYLPYGQPGDDPLDPYNLAKNSNLANSPSITNFMNYPTDADQIMLVNYKTTWASAYESPDGWAAIYDFDPFVVNGYVNAVLVSTMSDYSLPRLDA